MRERRLGFGKGTGRRTEEEERTYSLPDTASSAVSPQQFAFVAAAIPVFLISRHLRLYLLLALEQLPYRIRPRLSLLRRLPAFAFEVFEVVGLVVDQTFDVFAQLCGSCQLLFACPLPVSKARFENETGILPACKMEGKGLSSLTSSIQSSCSSLQAACAAASRRCTYSRRSSCVGVQVRWLGIVSSALCAGSGCGGGITEGGRGMAHGRCECSVVDCEIDQIGPRDQLCRLILSVADI